ncbi:DoxX family protein [Pseudotabrizicola algicola]|uniref:DoxX family protein n=1 Tax=Pseudotabrizicola algicola TaxID=2709381 RepID=A0A6B3RR85_9RHOB|nr:DoxX family protein [Pseudotabrizicola algicola]NEX48660.1 DoxX family protein [Pseudotabrizicola algicola]
MFTRLVTAFSAIPDAPVALMLRVFPALVFWQSGRTKVEGFAIKESTWFLFEHEYALPLIPPEIAAVMASVAEHLLPVLLILGLCTRLSALGLLAMTAVIQVFVYPGAWVTHGLWAAPLLAVLARGPGRWSLDFLAGLEGGPDRAAGHGASHGTGR